jgi:hypothetical protein
LVVRCKCVVDIRRRLAEREREREREGGREGGREGESFPHGTWGMGDKVMKGLGAALMCFEAKREERGPRDAWEGGRKEQGREDPGCTMVARYCGRPAGGTQRLREPPPAGGVYP